MIAETAERYGVRHLGIGTDLCQDQPDSIVTWMRNGRWSKETDFGEGSAANPGFPPQPDWFKGNLDFRNIAAGLSEVGFSAADVDAIMGGNWMRYYDEAFGPA